MPSAFKVKPSHKPVKNYYAALARGGRLKMIAKLATHDPFTLDAFARHP